jgi:hypothetical protein
MKNITCGLAAAVVGGLILAGGSVRAEGPQFRDSITVQGSIVGSSNEHHLTFSAPLALPGVALAPGTYIFRRVGGNVLQVSNAKRRPYTMMTTASVTRTARLDSYEIVLGPPLADGAPRRIVAWFAPGESTGQQLLYPSSRR